MQGKHMGGLAGFLSLLALAGLGCFWVYHLYTKIDAQNAKIAAVEAELTAEQARRISDMVPRGNGVLVAVAVHPSGDADPMHPQPDDPIQQKSWRYIEFTWEEINGRRGRFVWNENDVTDKDRAEFAYLLNHDGQKVAFPLNLPVESSSATPAMSMPK